MARPLLITDCDEVLLHMVVPFRAWLDEIHAVHFDFANHEFVGALRRKECGTVLEQGHVWDLLLGFFETQMHRQQPIDGALAALDTLSRVADIVVLTNITERDHQRREEQLAKLGVHVPVRWNQGGKGTPVAALIEEYAPSVAVFVDDLAQHHDSVERHAPDVWRLHMVGEPEMAPTIAPAPRAHARIDHWAQATAWITERFAAGPAHADIPMIGARDAA